MSSTPALIPMPFRLPVTIVFRGNSIDGLFSAVIAANKFKESDIRYFPIGINLKHTFPKAEDVKGRYILFCGTTVDQKTYRSWGKDVLSYCIDNNVATVKTGIWNAINSRIVEGVSVSALTWANMFPGVEFPEWLKQIDRIERWSGVTEDDRCMREHLQKTAKLPVAGNMEMAMQQALWYINNSGVAEQYSAMVDAGKIEVDAKDIALKAIMATHGRCMILDEVAIETWHLPREWNGLKVFIMNNTGIVVDSTTAGHLAITQLGADVYVNYRKKMLDGGVESVAYNARAREGGVDLTKRGIFFGHPTSAGAIRRSDKTHIMPFILA
jgi:hypothetical protein